jgi:hypothetical protein
MLGDKAAMVLRGPLGRALLAEIVGINDFALYEGITLATKVAEALPKLGGLASCDDELALLAAFQRNPLGFGFQGDHADWDLYLSEGAEDLVPVAEALVSCPASEQWWNPLATDAQRWLGCAHWSLAPPRGEIVERGLYRSVEVEAASQVDPQQVAFYKKALRHDNYGGAWWSSPHGQGIVMTSRSGPGEFPCFDLATIEDGFGEETFEVWEMEAEPEARIFEVRSPEDWRDLINLAPLDVTITRNADWARWTGKRGPWFLPDWRIVGETFDAVHMTMGGYLATRGAAIEVDGGFTLLAGWNAESTLWLRDAFHRVHRTETWTGRPGQDGLPNPFRI